MKLIVGLGNPGQTYRFTLHNMGFWLIDRLAESEGIEVTRKGWKSLYGRGKVGREEVILAKPQSYMNLSGEAVSQLLQFFKIPPGDLIVLHDDLDLPRGKIRIRLGGGDGGHQGIRSIIEALGNRDFLRLKAGIGRPLHPSQDPADYVLAFLSESERAEFREPVRRGAEAVKVLVLNGLQKAMNQFHGDGEEKGAQSES